MIYEPYDEIERNYSEIDITTMLQDTLDLSKLTHEERFNLIMWSFEVLSETLNSIVNIKDKIKK